MSKRRIPIKKSRPLKTVTRGEKADKALKAVELLTSQVQKLKAELAKKIESRPSPPRKRRRSRTPPLRKRRRSRTPPRPDQKRYLQRRRGEDFYNKNQHYQKRQQWLRNQGRGWNNGYNRNRGWQPQQPHNHRTWTGPYQSEPSHYPQSTATRQDDVIPQSEIKKRTPSRSASRKRTPSRSPSRKRSPSRSPSRKRSPSRSPSRKRSPSRSPSRNDLQVDLQFDPLVGRDL